MNTVEILRRLVAFPTVSHTSNAEITDWISRFLTECGFETERLSYRDASDTDKHCLAAVLAADDAASAAEPSATGGVSYWAHTDVVSADSWSFPLADAWTLTQSDGRYYGRGACDMKGSLACALQAASRLTHRPRTGNLYFFCTSDEEVGYHGARQVVKHSRIYHQMLQQGVPAIIGEPTLLQPVHAHKGGRCLKVIADGIAAHSSTEEGQNANMKMIPFLTWLRAKTEQLHAAPEWQDSRFSPPTLTMNIGVNDGNPAVNITSPRSICTMYFRPMPGQDADGLVEEIKAKAAELELRSELIFSGDALWTDPQAPFIQQICRLADAKPSRTVAYGTDGAVVSDQLDRVVIGPGSIAQAHTDDEWISADQLQQGETFYQLLFEEYCTGPA